MKTKRAQQFLGLLDKNKQSNDLDLKIKILISKGKLPQPIKIGK